MDQVVRGLDFVYVYIDDLLVASSTPEEHEQHLRKLFARLAEYGLVINPDKCEFGKPELTFPGHHISKDGILPLQEKVQVILDFPLPSSTKKLREFLGTCQLLPPIYRQLCHTPGTTHRLADSGRSTKI